MLSRKLACELDTLQKVEEFLKEPEKHIQAKIGIFGGRTFTAQVGGKNCQFKFNDLAKHIASLAKDELNEFKKKTTLMPERLKLNMEKGGALSGLNMIREIEDEEGHFVESTLQKKLQAVDLIGRLALEKASPFKQFLTQLKRLFTSSDIEKGTAYRAIRDVWIDLQRFESQKPPPD